ncbi:MAG: hypothetical protein E7178_00970 [Erysipelotrichaceae bacterium]|nr:hypothetical protein [Erysipelotrichaceae bacterium]
MFSKKYVVGPSDADQNLNAKISTLFVYMQDVAMEHAEQLGIGKENTMDKGMMWVVTRTALTIYRLPKYLEEVIVTTYPGDDMKFIYPRYYNIKDKHGNLLVIASATWMVLNKSTHTVNFNPFNGKVLPSEHMEKEEPLPGRLAPSEVSLIDTRKVRNSDVDINNHLNNTRYIEYITDSHDNEFYNKHSIHHLTIEYKKEIKINQKVEIYSNNANPEYIQARVDGDTCFEVSIDYR